MSEPVTEPEVQPEPAPVVPETVAPEPTRVPTYNQVTGAFE